MFCYIQNHFLLNFQKLFCLFHQDEKQIRLQRKINLQVKFDYLIYNNNFYLILDKSQVGLGNVNNTSDIDKPISSATQTALNLKLQSSTEQNGLTDEDSSSIAVYDNEDGTYTFTQPEDGSTIIPIVDYDSIEVDPDNIIIYNGGGVNGW